MISFVQVLENLVDVRGIKCTYKEGDRISFSGKKEEIMNSVQDSVLVKVHFSPSSLNFFQLNP
jgi:hypothetical protein